MHKYLLLFCLLAFFAPRALAQQPDTSTRSKKITKDTLVSTKHDTVVTRSAIPKVKKEKIYHPDSTHNVHTAVMRSLIIPGWGQLYNHRWWKVPVIYGGIGLLGVAIVFNNTNYNEFLVLSKYREHGITPTPKDKYYNEYQLYAPDPDQAIYDATDGYRRNRDLCILGVLGAWGINVIDAYIDAKFIRAYSIDSNLSMRIAPAVLNQPAFAQNALGSFIPGIKITFALN